MAKFVQFGRCIDYVNPSSSAIIAAGDLVAVGDNFYGVADHPIPVLQQGTLTIAGVYDVPATATISVGATVYAGASNTCNVTSGASTRLGRAVSPATSGGVCRVLING